MLNTAFGERDSYREYYGQVLAAFRDQRSAACRSAPDRPARLLPLLRQIHPEIQDRFYGCGAPIPAALEGASVLVLGCGRGRDCYLLSQLVGPHGRVLGIDLDADELAIAERHFDYHAERFGYANVRFLRTCGEELSAISDASLDVVLSSCMLNLSVDLPRVLAELFRVLKPGGELCVSEIFADRRIPESLRADLALKGECLAGACYQQDFRRLLAMQGCADARVLASAPLELQHYEIERRFGPIGFSRSTFRAFKLPLEDRCEDFGQTATYLGTLPEHPERFALDDHHLLEIGQALRVCGNTADMLGATRYAPHFRIEGDKSVHHGPFDCSTPTVTPTSTSTSTPAPAAACGPGCC